MLNEPTDTKRDTLMRLFDAGRVNGVAYLFALIALGRASAPELSELCGDERHTVGRYLQRLESRGFAQRVQSGNGELWHPTPKALAMFGGKLSGDSRPQAVSSKTQVENLPELPSSSDQIRDQELDQADQIDQSEEEEILRQKNYLLKHYQITGYKSAQLAADGWVTPLRLVAWMAQVADMQRDGFKFRKSREAYAITCLLRHDDPNSDSLSIAPRLLAAALIPINQSEEIDDDAEEPDAEQDLAPGQVDAAPIADQSLEHKLFWTAAARAQADLGGLFQIVASSDVTIDGSTYTLRPSISCAFRAWRDKIERTLTAAVRDTADDDDLIVVISNDWKSDPD